MKIAVLGAGGVGGYFGGRLAQAGHDVTFVARGAHRQAIEQNGLAVTSPKGDFVIRPAAVTDDPSTVGPVDLVLLGVKAGQVPDVAPAIRGLIRETPGASGGPATVVVPLQNGVEAADDLVQALGAGPVVGGLCRIVASITGPGQVTHHGVEPTIVIGELDHSSSERVAWIRDGFESAGIAVDLPGNIHVALWEKLLLVAPWGGLGGLTGLPLDALCEAPETRRLLERSMTEVARVAAARGAGLPDGTVEKTAQFLAALPPGGTASMQRDLMDGRPSELDTQIGAIVRLGRAADVDTPVNAFIYDCLAPVERRARRARP